jgi:hypothetical protein
VKRGQLGFGWLGCMTHSVSDGIAPRCDFMQRGCATGKVRYVSIRRVCGGDGVYAVMVDMFRE